MYNFTTDLWLNLEPLENPGPRFAYSTAYDIAADRIILFGGAADEDDYRNDTWSYDMNTNTWMNMSPVVAPGVRFGASMVYDSESDVIVLFGGIDFPNFLGHHIQQTWAYDFDSNNWTNMEPALQPIGRHHASMTYDSAADRVILFGGYVSSATNEASEETWSYDYNSNTWIEMDTDSNPEGRFYGALSYDAASNRSVLYGGAWEYSSYHAELGDTWAYDYESNDWEKMNPDPHPPERWRHSMVYNEVSDTIILVGGSFGSITGGESRTDAMWEYDYDNDTWSSLDGNFNPPPPGAPENPIVMTYDGAVILTWEPPFNETGQAIMGYNVYRGTEQTNMVLYASLGPILFYQDISMSPGVTYYYSISAVTPTGEGLPSVVFTAGIPPLFPIVEVSVVAVVGLVIIGLFIRRQRGKETWTN
jgi:N-acetylneuraminic acid mutarotase